MYELEVGIRNCKQESDSMVDYFGKLTELWDVLDNYEKAPDCCYGGLTCKQFTGR